MAAPILLTASGLGMIRGERILFEGVGVDLRAGEAIVLRGANGSGKTTLLRILAGLTRPEAGRLARDVPHHWMGHQDGLKPHETPRNHLRLWARAWGSDAEIEPVLDEMGLIRASDVPARHLSAGQRRRTALARLKLESRPIWLLDEPFNALDDEGAARIEQMITAHRNGGGGVIAALHGNNPFSDTTEMAL